VLLPFAWPLVRGQQERGHKRKTPTFTVLQAAGAWPLTETVRDADKGGNVEEGGVFPRSSPRGHPTGCCPAISPNLVNRCCSASTGSVTRGARSIRSSCAWADALASPASRSTRTPSGTREPGSAGARLRPRDAGQATEPRHADTRTPQQYDDVAPAAGPCRAPSQTSSKNSSSSKVCARSGLETSQRLLEALGVGIVGAHRARKAGPTGADHGQANATAFERLGRAAQHPALAMGEDEAPQLGVDPHGAR
jgi:hypothetical protein